MPQTIFHSGKEELDQIVIWRVWGEKFVVHAATSNISVQITTATSTYDLPGLNEVCNFRTLMNPAIVHYNYRVWRRKGLHSIKSSLNELVECGGIKSPFNDVTMKYSIIE